jgi:hypothetical protein
MPPSGGVERDINLDSEVDRFTTADRVALGDLGIRKTVAWFRRLALCERSHDDCCGDDGAGRPVIDSKVIMTMIGGTTVQLGTIVLTMTQALFPKRRPE